MQEKEYVTPPLPAGIKVRWDRIFDMDLVYRRMKYWLDFQGFSNFEEQEYSETIKGDARELRIMWHAEKEETPYFGYVIQVRFLILGMKDVVVNKEGREIKMNKGSFELRIDSYVARDYKNRFSSKIMQRLYERFIAKQRIEHHKEELFNKVNSFAEDIRKILAM